MEKYDLIRGQLLHEGIVNESAFFEPEIVDRKHLERVHNSLYIDHLLNLTLDSKMARRIGFPLSASLIERERRIAQGTIQGALFALKYGVSFNIAGGTHHAGRAYGDGFCMFNDQAVAAAYLLAEKKTERILIVDLDVHQGDGTADIFHGSEDVYTLSIHSHKNYPFQKKESTCDIGLEDKTEDAEYLEIVENALHQIFTTFDPDFVFYQAGVDVLATDKLGRISISPEGCKRRDELVFEKCLEKGLPVQVSMGGGYSPQIKDIVNAHIQTYKSAIRIFNI